MSWFKTTMTAAALGFLGVFGYGQDASRPANAIRLGTPTRLDDGVVQAGFSSMAPASADVQPAAFAPLPPRIVRGSRPLPDDRPIAVYKPFDFSIVEDTEPSRINDAPRFERVTQSLPEPATFLPDELPKTITVAANRETIVIVDERGNPINNAESIFDPLGRFYARAEFLWWWTRGFRVPPLVTTASPFDPERTRGALGFGSTSILNGDDRTTSGGRPGGRFTLGYSLDPCGLCSIEGNFFFLGQRNDNALFDSNAFPVLARPFFNINDGTPDRELTTSPALVPGDVFKSVGSIRVDSSSSLLGAELNLLRQACCNNCSRLSYLVGFRYLQLRENLGITEDFVVQQDIPAAPPNIPILAGDQITVFDLFETTNRFYGGQVGLTGERHRGRWTMEGTVKLAFGATRQSVDINGGQEITSRGATRTFVGGLYALPSNIGHHTQTRFGFVPEVGVKLGYNLSDNVRVYVGYDFLYWSSVLRPGDQIDPVLDLNQVPNSGGPFPPASQVRPRVPFQTSSYWAQGVNAGLLIRY